MNKRQMVMAPKYKSKGAILFHSEEEPSIIYDDTEYWYLNGKLSRTDGPAVCRVNGRTDEHGWYIDGDRLDFDVWCNKTNKTDEEITLIRVRYGLG